MNRTPTPVLSLAVALTLGWAGCAEPIHLGYDHGRAFTESMELQGDLTRPAVLGRTYDLYGVEAAAIRLNARSASTAAEKAEAGFEVEGGSAGSSGDGNKRNEDTRGSGGNNTSINR